MVTLTSRYTNAIFEPLDLHFVNGFKTLTEAQFEAMKKKDIEYFNEQVRKANIIILSSDQKPKVHQSAVQVKNMTEQTPRPSGIPVVKIVTGEVGEALETSGDVEGAEPEKAPSPPKENMAGTITKPQVGGSEVTKATPRKGGKFVKKNQPEQT